MLSFDHWLGGGPGLDDETTFAMGVIFSAALAAALFGRVMPGTVRQPDAAERAGRQGIACALLGLVTLPALFLGAPVVLGAAAVALGLRGGRTNVALLAVVAGLVPVALAAVDVAQGGDNPDVQIIR